MLLLIVLSFTDIPYYAYYNLGTTDSKLTSKPDLIVVLGGAGMPSSDGLMRCYYAAEAANQFKDAKIIIALPYNENETDSLWQLKLMSHELIIRQIDATRIGYEPLGFNTHSQAVNIAKVLKNSLHTISVLIITSPEHMYRSVRSFYKVGFAHVSGMATFEKPVDEIKIEDTNPSKDLRVKSLAIRYNMWSYLHYELLVLREYSAICYYKIKGWM